MKHPLRLLSLLVIALVLVRGSEYVLEQILDRHLPPLLTEELGLPVRIAPLRADIFSLTATTPRLEMGEPDRLSIDAHDVWVSLDWADLLGGEIRLVSGAGRELMLDISAWPRDDGPPSEDYANLEQWLPSMLDVHLVRYRTEDGEETEFHQARWRRAGPDIDNASLAWQSRFPTGTLDIDIDLDSLDDLLWLRDFNAAIALTSNRDAIAMSELDLRIRPGQGTVYDMDLSGQLEGTALELAASGSESWTWPDRSHIRMKELYLKDLREFLTLFFADGEEDAYQREMAGAVPVINLPRHDAVLEIGELRAGDEMLHDVGFKLTSSGNYLAITEIRAAGLYGDLLGSAAIATIDKGWELALAADLKARTADHGLLSRYVASHWYAREGRARLQSRGGTWTELLDELTGDLKVSGVHRAEKETPFSLRAELDGSPDRFALEQLQLHMGQSTLSGQLKVSSRNEKVINLSANGNQLDLRFLFHEKRDLGDPGVALPTYLTWLPDYQVIADLNFEALILEGVELDAFEVTLDRGVERGTMSLLMKGDDGGSLGIDLSYQETGDAVDTRLGFKLQRVDLTDIFNIGFTSDELQTRASGTIDLTARGRDVKEVFSNSRGLARVKLEARDDQDWTRDSKDSEVIDFSGQTSLVIEGDSIVGLTVEQIDIDSVAQDLTGTLSLVVTRDPVLEAKLTSEQLNIDRLVEWIPEATDAETDSAGVKFLLDLFPGHFSVHVDSLTWQQRGFDNVDLKVASKPGAFNVEHLHLVHRGAALDGSMTLSGKGASGATFDAKASIEGLRVLEVLDIDEQQLRDKLSAPLVGKLELKSEADTFAALFMGLNGELSLDSTDPAEQDPDQLRINFERLADGGLIKIESFKLAGSDLQGELRTTAGTPVRYDLNVTSGTVDLRPWALAQKPAKSDQDAGSKDGVVQQTADAAGNLLGFVGRLFGEAGETAPGQRIFSSEPLDLSVLFENDVTVRAKLGRVYSSEVVAEDLELEGLLGGGKVSIKARAEQANGGAAHIDLGFDGSVSPNTLRLEAFGDGFHRRPEQSSYPSSLHIIANATGSSEAELAATLNGQMYIELGRGPIDYGGLAFLTADAASSMFRALIPGAKDRVPEVRCGVTFMQMKDGMGVTPYGYAAQTRSANLLGGIELNLIKERLRIRFRSRSREGVGLSIGNAFSSTVELAGPLGDPKIVPNTPGLLFRGWAAFMTAGLSVLGESVINRVLASDNPCEPVKQEIREEVCNTDQVLSDSPLACPAPATAAN